MRRGELCAIPLIGASYEGEVNSYHNIQGSVEIKLKFGIIKNGTINSPLQITFTQSQK
jgi:hypothetical protein